MAAVPDSRSGAGGKMVANRRRQRLTATPYDRPLSLAPPKSPNWFTGVIIPSARALASGAGKFISSAIFSGSESSSSEDVDSASEDDGGNVNEYESPCGGGNALNEEILTSSEMRRESQLSMQRSETKWLIEQLIMQENFSREECDRLTKVLNSRVKDWSIEAGDKRSFASYPRQADDGEDILNKAVLEAKKWFQENRGSSSVAELARGTCNPNSAVIDHMESEVGSPVDMARSYMRERPPWASPTEHVELRTPLTTTMKHFEEQTPYSVTEDVLSSSKRRNYLASGSWNIQEELRKVRSKAVEDMLRTPAKNDSSLFAVAATQEDLTGTRKVASSAGEEIYKPHSFWRTKPIGELMDVGVNADPACPCSFGSGQDGKDSEAPSLHPDASASGIIEKDPETIPSDGLPSDPSYPTSPGHAKQLHSADPHATEISGPPETAAAELGARAFTNGSSPTQARHDEENHEDTTAGIEVQSTNGTNVDGNCELLTEAFMEFPVVTETDSINNSGSQIPKQTEESHFESTKPSTEGKPDLTSVKQQGKRVVRNTKRSRGRGK